MNEKLRQEVVKLTDREDRMAALCVLLEGSFKKRTIVFFKTKEQCHRASIILGLKGKNCAELHGNLTQTLRIEALDEFKNGNCEILLASDLVARGLDIKNVRYVINFELPQEMTRYIHRVGRTARFHLKLFLIINFLYFFSKILLKFCIFYKLFCLNYQIFH